MPYSPLKPCPYPMCKAKVKRGYCEKHERTQPNSFKVKKAHPFYNKTIWKGKTNRTLGTRGGLREAQLKRQPFCSECKEQGRYVQATVVDHKKPFKGKENAWELFVDSNNHDSLCAFHHNSKTGKGL